MARRKAQSAASNVFDQHEELVAEYRAWLSEAEPAPAWPWPPVTLGPTWQRAEDGGFLLPDRTLGWDVLAWCGIWLQFSRDVPWRFTKEQARFVLWWYAVDEDGRFLFHDGVLQRLKGWGKDPLAACLLLVEMLGPCRFAGWDDEGQPLAQDVPDAWVQTAAVSLEQTKNTMRLLPALISPAAKRRFGMPSIGKEKVYALGDERLLEAVTSSPATLEGARSTFIILNETHHWLAANDGHEMAAVISRNAAKSPDGAARTLRITNAYEPGQDSVAQRDREAFDKMAAGATLMSGLLYDSLEANEDAPLTAEAAPLVVPSIRGDSVWLSPERIVQEILDLRNPPSQSRRFWYNQITAAEDSWTTPQQFDGNRRDGLQLSDGDQIALFFDGSKSDDATGLTACRISDGAVFVRGVWERPERIAEWSVPREDVNGVVEETFTRFDVVGFLADPGAGEDDSGQRYWDALIDRWSEAHGDTLCVWATPGGADRHAVMWDMRSADRSRLFTEAAERALGDIAEGEFPHDGNPRLRIHVLNARRRPGRYGVSIGKEHRESARKIDLAVCAIGARMVRRQYLALPETKQRRTIGLQIFI